MPDLAELNLVIKSDSARKAQKDLDALDVSGKKVDKTIDDVNKGSRELDATNDSLAKAIRELTVAARAITSALRGLNTTTDRAGDEFAELDRLIEQNDKEVRKFTRDLEALGNETREAANDTEAFNKSQKAAQDGVDNLKRRMLQLIAVYATYRTALSVVDTLADFEIGLIGVAKTANLTAEETDRLGRRIRDLSLAFDTPTGQLLEIAKAAGQVGVTGVDNLVQFAETVARLGSATDLSGEEATIALARLLTVTGEAADQVGKLGSVITFLGNTTAASEAEIARIALEVGKATGAFGTSSTEAAGLAAAMAQVGTEAELAGSTSFRVFKVITDAARQGGPALEELAELTGMTADEFARLANNSPVAAFEAFIRGLGQAKDESRSLTDILVGLNLESVRDANVILPLANGYELFAQKLADASAEAERQTALIEESEKSNNSLRGSITRLGNAFEAVQTDYSGATTSLQKFTNLLGETLLALFDVDQAGVEVSGTAESLARFIEVATAALVSFGLALLFIKLQAFIDGLGGAAAAFRLLTAAIASNPLGALAVAVTAVASALYILGPALQSTTDDVDDYFKSVDRARSATDLFTQAAARGEQAFSSGALNEQASALRQLAGEFDAFAVSLRANKSVLEDADLESIKNQLIEIQQAGRGGGLGNATLLRGLTDRAEVGRISGLLDQLLRDVDRQFGGEFADVLLSEDDFAKNVATIKTLLQKELSDEQLFSGRNTPADVLNFVNNDRADAARKALREILERIADGAEADAEFLQKEYFDKVLPSADDLSEISDVFNEIAKQIELVGASDRAVRIGTVRERVTELGEAAGLTGDELAGYVEQAVALTNALIDKEEAHQGDIDAMEASEAAAIAAAEAEVRLQDAINNTLTALDNRLELLRKEVELADAATDARRIEVEVLRERQRLLAQGVPEVDFAPRLDELRSLLTQQSEIRDAGKTDRRAGRVDPVERLQEEVRVSRELLEVQRSRLDADLELEEQVIRAQGPIVGSLTDQQREIESLIRLQSQFRSEIDAVQDAADDYDERLRKTADSINDSFSSAFASIITGTESVADSFRNLANELLTLFIRRQVLSPLVGSLNPGGLFASFFTPAGGVTPSAQGNAFGAGGVYPFATGGVFGPTMFTFGGGKLGVMGEEGPEAVMPLKRDAQGNLGVANVDGGGGGRSVNVTIVARDAESYKRSRTQIGEDINRAVNRRVPRGAR